MGTTLLLKTNYSIDDTKSVVLEAFEKQIDFVHSRFIKFDSECKEFEIKYKMKSELFLTKFESGELGDTCNGLTGMRPLGAESYGEKNTMS
jgi:hypothetical protein